MPEGSENKGAKPEQNGNIGEPGKQPDPPKPDGDKPLGPNGEKALESERTARKELERQVQQLQQQHTTQMSALAEAFGIKPEGAKPEEMVSTLQQQVSEMQHRLLVDRVARKHQITENDDLELLASAKDEQVMDRLATRLAAKAGEGEAGPGTPKPDLTQGGQGGTSQGGSTAEQFAAAVGDALNR